MTDPFKVKADILPYSDEYARSVLSWIECEETLYNLCRSKDFPPQESLIKTWHRKDVTPYLLFSSNKPVAYGELWKRPMEMAMEIAHLLVDPYKRSEGFGSIMLELLYQRAAQKQGITKVMITLYGTDEAALGCYLKAGFELTGTTTISTGLKMVRIVD